MEQKAINNVNTFRLMGKFDKKLIPWPLNDLQVETLARFREAIEKKEIVLQHKYRCECGSARATQISNIDRFGLPFGSYLCDDCGLLYTSPVIASESMEFYYNDFYHPLHFGKPASDKALYAVGQGTKIFKYVSDRLSTINSKEINILEIGSGSGTVIKEFMKAAVEREYKVKGIGLEYSKDYINCFDSEGLDLNIRCGGLKAVQKDDGPFELIIMSHVLEHFHDPDMELGELKRLLKPESLLYIEVPGIFSLKQRYTYNCDYLRYFTAAHLFHFNLASLTYILNRNGFMLLWGNEEVESIFKMGEQSIDVDNNASLIKSYLTDLEISQGLYVSLSPESLRDRLGIKALETKTQNLETKTQNLETKTQNLETKTQNLETKTQNLETKTQNLETKTRQIENKMRDISEALKNIESFIEQIRTTLPYRAVRFVILALRRLVYWKKK